VIPKNEVIFQALEFQTVPEHLGRVSPNEATFPALVCVQEVHLAHVPASKDCIYSCLL